MNQIPDHAAERVLGTIQEVINSADEELGLMPPKSR